MRRSTQTPYTTVRSEGGVLPADLLQRVASGDRELPGLRPEDYHLAPGERLAEATARAWTRLRPLYEKFRAAEEKLPQRDTATGVTRDRWLLPLFEELHFGRLQPAHPVEIGERAYPVSYLWNSTPIELTGWRADLDHRSTGAHASPHGLVQELLNRSDAYLWGIVSNGRKLRVLRDNKALTRAAYVEFDLEALFEGELYSDFALLYLLCHESRFEEDPAAGAGRGCWLERWSRQAERDGTRALDKLREGVEKALVALGAGFIEHPANAELRARLASGSLTGQEYYRQLLRLIYRLLFLLVAEQRDLLLRPGATPETRELYTRYYGVSRLRDRSAGARQGAAGARHADLWRGLQVALRSLHGGCEALGLPALGGSLFEAGSLESLGSLESARLGSRGPEPGPTYPKASNGSNDSFASCSLRNGDLLAAIRALTLVRVGRVRRLVDYRNLGVEELGSVYEALLELHPKVDVERREFSLGAAAGSERKTTGSYYTPDSLVQCLLDSALEPVIQARLCGAGTPDPEAALLSLRICDPACGSGHFLVGAARRLARRLASIRTGEEEPAPDALRLALRDVIGRCVYGVDINPMAVELCKVALWIEALTPGLPLSFLDHHIQCGNSLLGATPELMAQGIPDAAFDQIEGDDRAFCSQWKKRNRQQRTGQQELELGAPWERLGNLAASIAGLDSIPDDSLAGVERRRKRWEEAVRSTGYENNRLLADAWLAAFVWPKRDAEELPYPITERIFRAMERNPHSAEPWMKAEVQRLAEEYRFFHWHLAFPDVFCDERVFGVGGLGAVGCAWPPGATAAAAGSGAQPGGTTTPKPPTTPRTPVLRGFDVVLGNPPWERVKLQEKEWFAARAPEIAAAPTAAVRRRMIEALRDDPGGRAIYDAFVAARRRAEGESALARRTGTYPLTGRGDVNTYALFAELFRGLQAQSGRAGVIVPSGIATDDTTSDFFADLSSARQLACLYDFENRQGLFPAVDSRQKFCLLSLRGSGAGEPADFVFFAHDTAELADPGRHIALSAEDIALLNPNTRTCPIFRSRRDAEITKAIYRRVPVLIRENALHGNPWGLTLTAMFHMSGASDLFKGRSELEDEGWRLEGNIFTRGGERYLPLYEAKMVDFYDHRAADVVLSDTARTRQRQPEEISDREKADPRRLAMPQSWVPEDDVEERLAPADEDGRFKRPPWERGWLLGWRNVTSSTNERTLIASLMPLAAVGHSIQLALPTVPTQRPTCLLCSLVSLPLDYAARQKVGGINLTYHLIRQFPVPPPGAFGANPPAPFDAALRATGGAALRDWILPRVLELVYTAVDMAPFAQDCGYTGEPFTWNPDRRAILRAELDALFFHVYGLNRDDAEYVLGTFPVLEKNEQRKYGEYRTKRLVLDAYDAIAAAGDAGRVYQSPLRPGPAGGWRVEGASEGGG